MINEAGQILSLYSNKILKLYITWDGYARITVNKKQYKVHRLVAETLIPNPHNLPQVNHIDGNKLNNAVDNLEWCTAKDNLVHAYKIGLHPGRKRTPVVMDNFLRFDSIVQANKVTGVQKSDICSCCKGLRRTAGGHTWKYFNFKEDKYEASSCK